MPHANPFLSVVLVMAAGRAGSSTGLESASVCCSGGGSLLLTGFSKLDLTCLDLLDLDFDEMLRFAMRRSSCAMTQPRFRTTLAVLSLTTFSTTAALSSSAAASGSLHDLTGTRIDAKSVSMSDFLGKPVLVLNVASR